MSIASNFGSLIVKAGETVSLSQWTNLSKVTSANYLIVNGFDRNEYTVNASGATGSFTGGGHTMSLSALGGDFRGAGIVFAYNPAAGRYTNATYGNLDGLTYTASTSLGDVTHISLFATNSASTANNDAANAIALAQNLPAGYLGSLTIASPVVDAGPAAPQATPLSVAAIAQTFVGAVCNANGCWGLASTIAAQAGASLPVQSAVNMPGAANGQWIVAFNGPAGGTGDWTAAVRTGDMVGFVNAAGTGHITTVVSGAGSTAMVIDNIAVKDARGNLRNGANDGSANDLIVQPAHAASKEWAGVSASSVVIFRLDTPVVATLQATLNVAVGGTANLASLFAATDPAGKPITAVQAYAATAADGFAVNGTAATATSAATAVSASSLEQIDFHHGASDANASVMVRAYNGTAWGDWTQLGASIDHAGIDPVSVGTASNASPDSIAIHRFFDRTDGTHFFTASSAEASSLAATRTDLAYEGIGLHGYAAADTSSGGDAAGSRVAVFRFFDLHDGTHFYTASTAERDSLTATPAAAMKFEGVAFYENATPQPGDTAVYRFFDTNHGTHLFTQSAGEKASILATRPDLVSEGIAFYAPL